MRVSLLGYIPNLLTRIPGQEAVCSFASRAASKAWESRNIISLGLGTAALVYGGVPVGAAAAVGAITLGHNQLKQTSWGRKAMPYVLPVAGCAAAASTYGLSLVLPYYMMLAKTGAYTGLAGLAAYSVFNSKHAFSVAKRIGNRFMPTEFTSRCAAFSSKCSKWAGNLSRRWTNFRIEGEHNVAKYHTEKFIETNVKMLKVVEDLEARMAAITSDIASLEEKIHKSAESVEALDAATSGYPGEREIKQWDSLIESITTIEDTIKSVLKESDEVRQQLASRGSEAMFSSLVDRQIDLMGSIAKLGHLLKGSKLDCHQEEMALALRSEQ